MSGLMFKGRPLTRRSVLRGMIRGAAISVALPPLEAFMGRTKKASASGASSFPKRFGLFMWGNGVVPTNWVPSQTGTQYTLSELLMPLAPVQSAITVISGTQVMTPNVEPHFSGAAGILSASGLQIASDGSYTFAAPSIDQVIANAIGGQTRFPSLQFGADPGSGLSYNGPNDQNPPETSPQNFFNTIFVNGFTPPGQTPKIDPMIGVRVSILDAITSDASSLMSRLGSIDRARLDAHLTGIRELELRLANTMPPTLASCAVPAEPPATFAEQNGQPDISTINRAFCDVMAMALACDQTRVFSNYFTYPVSNPLFPGAPEGHHQLTHDEPGTTQPEVSAIVVQIMTEFNYLLTKLQSVPEGDGTLLDNCVIFGTTDCSFGQTHTLTEYPIVLAGTAGGALNTGFHYRSTTGENSSEVLFSILNAMDIPTASFGSGAGMVTSGLSAIEASS